MAKKPRIKTGIYWNEEFDKILDEFKTTRDSDLYTQVIEPKFRIVAESLFYLKLPKYHDREEEVINDIITLMYQALDNWDITKGRGFGYLSVAAKNGIIAHAVKKQKYVESHVSTEESKKNIKNEECDYQFIMDNEAITEYYNEDRTSELIENLYAFLDWCYTSVEKEKQNNPDVIPMAKLIIDILRDGDVPSKRDLKRESLAVAKKKGIKDAHKRWATAIKIIRTNYMKYMKKHKSE